MNNILVTGHKGYIGSHLYKKLIAMGHKVDGLDIKDGKDIVYCLPNKSYDFVFHMAALPSVSFSMENPSYTLRNNVFATSVLLEWAKKKKVKCVIFSSSAAVLGDNGSPNSPYGLHKMMCEMECSLYTRIYGLDTVCLRYFNVYSEDQKYGGAYSSVISAWMEMLRCDKPLRVDGDGQQTRDFIHVDDVVGANIFTMNIAERGLKWNGGILNVGSGTEVSIEYVKNIVNKYNGDVDWLSSPSRKGDIKNSVANIEELTKLGWFPSVSIEDGLKRCFEKKRSYSLLG